MSAYRLDRKQLTRRTFLKALGVGAVGIGIAACPPAQPAAPPAPEDAPAVQPVTEPVSLEYWFAADVPREREMYEDFVRAFQEQFPEIAIRADENPSLGELSTKLVTSWAAQAGLPDLVKLGAGWEQFVEMQALHPLDDWLVDWEHAPDMQESILDMASSQLDQNTYCMPEGATISYLYYRPDWLEELGLNPPDTDDELLEVAIALTSPPDRYGYAMRGGDSGGLVQQINHHWWGNGVDIVKEDGTVDIDSPEGIATVEWYQALHTQHNVTQPSALTDRFPELFAQYQGGRVGTFFHGLHSWREQDEALGENAAAAMVPRGRVSRGIRASLFGTFIISTTDHPEQAWQFASFVGAPEQARVISDLRGALPAFESLQNEPLYQENKYYRVAFDSAPYLREVPSWHRGWPVLSDRYSPELQRLLREEITPEQFCTTLADAMRRA